MTAHDDFAGHTPGPWEVRDRWFIASASRCCVIGRARRNLTGGIAATEANARLIAAAPTLLAEVTALRAENEALRLAVQGGEDAPGHASSIPLEVILDNARKLHADATQGWDAGTLRAEVARLREALEEIATQTEETAARDDLGWVYREYAPTRAAQIARAALQEPTP